MLIIITGMPGAGKSYSACDLIIRSWKKNPNKRIFTNFPVKWKDKSTMKWEPSMLQENIYDSIIIIDEAYKEFYSRDWKGFSKDDLLVFATSRHNQNVFVLISQSLASVDTELRRRAEIWWVSKVAIPNPRYLLQYDMWRPIWITTEVYDGEDSYKMRLVVGKKAVLRKKRMFFRKWIAKIYDTHFYGINTQKPYCSNYWFNVEKGEKKYGLLSINFRAVYSLGINLWLYLIGISRNAKQKTGYKNIIIYVITTIGIDIRINSQKILRWLNVIKLNWFNRFWIRYLVYPVYLLYKVYRKKQQKKKKQYNLYEKRGIIKEIIYKNWLLWRPIFKIIGLEK